MSVPLSLLLLLFCFVLFWCSFLSLEKAVCLAFPVLFACLPLVSLLIRFSSRSAPLNCLRRWHISQHEHFARKVRTTRCTVCCRDMRFKLLIINKPGHFYFLFFLYEYILPATLFSSNSPAQCNTQAPSSADRGQL